MRRLAGGTAIEVSLIVVALPASLALLAWCCPPSLSLGSRWPASHYSKLTLPPVNAPLLHPLHIAVVVEIGSLSVEVPAEGEGCGLCAATLPFTRARRRSVADTLGFRSTTRKSWVAVFSFVR